MEVLKFLVLCVRLQEKLIRTGFEELVAAACVFRPQRLTWYFLIEKNL